MVDGRHGRMVRTAIPEVVVHIRLVNNARREHSHEYVTILRRVVEERLVLVVLLQQKLEIFHVAQWMVDGVDILMVRTVTRELVDNTLLVSNDRLELERDTVITLP